MDPERWPVLSVIQCYIHGCPYKAAVVVDEKAYCGKHALEKFKERKGRK